MGARELAGAGIKGPMCGRGGGGLFQLLVLALPAVKRAMGSFVCPWVVASSQ